MPELDAAALAVLSGLVTNGQQPDPRPSAIRITEHDEVVIVDIKDWNSKAPNAEICSAPLLVQLERSGYLLLRHHAGPDDKASKQKPDKLRLAGGSICNTFFNRKTYRIEKRIGHSKLTSGIDGIDRHIAEFDFVANAPEMCKGLFPKAVLLNDELGLCLDQDFISGYTIGERVIRGELGSNVLCQTIHNLILRLNETLWHSRARGIQRSYLHVVARRFSELIGHPFFDRLWQHGATVNGSDLPSVRSLLTTAKNRWPVLMSLEGTGAHGDLVLEDIVTKINSSDIKLIDPNPQNCSWFIDCAKLMMSAMLKYEAIYADYYTFQSRLRDERLNVDFEMRCTNRWDCLDDLAGQLESTIDALYDGNLENDWKRILKVQACLHMLSLPAFHHIQHGKLDRSLVFATVAMSKMTELVA